MAINQDLNYRIKEWTPPERPEWVRKVNEEGTYLDLKGVVPLDEHSLIERAKHNTGLSDFGQDDWYEPFQVFIKSLEEEAELSLMGRLMTRSDILMHLEARLKVEETYKRHPEIEDEQIHTPIFILGSGRSGTSAIQNLLSLDPDNATPKHWEALFPAPPPEAATYHTDPRIEIADKRMTQWNRVTPEIESMHEFNGRMPTELIQIETLSFQSFAWLGLYGYCPSYIAYMHGRSALPAFSYAKRVLKLLQWKNPRRRWLLKEPMHLYRLEALRRVFPDACLVWPHRDPVRSLASLVSIIGTIQWGRSDHPFKGGTQEYMTDPALSAAAFNHVIDQLEAGVFPPRQVYHMLYQDLVADTLQAVEAMYRHFGIPLSGEGRGAMAKYLRDSPRDARPPHRFNAGSPEAVARARQAFKRYQDYFGIPSE